MSDPINKAPVELASPAAVRALLDRFGLAPHKQLGQNFLFDANILGRIAEAGALPGETVLEIGPGLGGLTQRLAAVAGRVVAVEIDSGMVQALGYTLQGLSNVEVLHEDFLKCDLGALHQKLGGGPFAVCANLPYYITTPIILRLLESGLPIRQMSFLVQKEAAERMAAVPSTKSYGSLSIAVQYYCDAKPLFAVPAGCFLPAPAVESLVLRLTPRTPPVTVRDEKAFFALTRCAFAMRRKTLVNNLTAALPISRQQAEEALRQAGLPGNIRGEAVDMAGFARLAEALG